MSLPSLLQLLHCLYPSPHHSNQNHGNIEVGKSTRSIKSNHQCLPVTTLDHVSLCNSEVLNEFFELLNEFFAFVFSST